MMFWSCFFNSSDGEKKNGSFRLSQRWITFRIWNGSKVDGKRVRNGCKINNGVMSGFFFLSANLCKWKQNGPIFNACLVGIVI